MATRRRKTKKSEVRTSNVVLVIMTILLILFTIRVLNIVEATGVEPGILIGSVFGAALGEAGILGWIKNTKTRSGKDNGGIDELPPRVG